MKLHPGGHRVRELQRVDVPMHQIMEPSLALCEASCRPTRSTSSGLRDLRGCQAREGAKLPSNASDRLGCPPTVFRDWFFVVRTCFLALALLWHVSGAFRLLLPHPPVLISDILLTTTAHCINAGPHFHSRTTARFLASALTTCDVTLAHHTIVARFESASLRRPVATTSPGLHSRNITVGRPSRGAKVARPG